MDRLDFRSHSIHTLYLDCSKLVTSPHSFAQAKMTLSSTYMPSVTSGQLVALDLRCWSRTVAVPSSNAFQLILKPLSEGRTRLVLLMWVRIRDDGVGFIPGGIGDNRTGKMMCLMQPMRGMDWEAC